MRRQTCIDDLVCGAFIVSCVLWLLIEILPAFFDGRVAAAIGGAR